MSYQVVGHWRVHAPAWAEKVSPPTMIRIRPGTYPVYYGEDRFGIPRAFVDYGIVMSGLFLLSELIPAYDAATSGRVTPFAPRMGLRVTRFLHALVLHWGGRAEPLSRESRLALVDPGPWRRQTR